MAYSIFKFYMKNQHIWNYNDIRVKESGYDIWHSIDLPSLIPFILLVLQLALFFLILCISASYEARDWSNKMTFLFRKGPFLNQGYINTVVVLFYHIMHINADQLFWRFFKSIYWHIWLMLLVINIQLMLLH